MLSPSQSARYVMIGGFLGAGKTTAITRLAQMVSAKGLKVGLITNDQGSNMVDTTLLRSRGFATEEIPGGCFCCRFNSLVEASAKLSETTAPDIFIAEPVGSCTDLVATVTYPLRRMYGDRFSVAPLSVLVDPTRALRILEVEPGGSFSDKVRYIYLKQLEEADLIVINKTDVLSSERRKALETALKLRFHQKEVVSVSARTSSGLDGWLEKILNSSPRSGQAIELDYQTYAEGEALLGWLNCTIAISAPQAWDANQLLRDLAKSIQRRLMAVGAEVAHLKMTISPLHGLHSIGAINVVRNDFVPELSLELPGPIESAQLILNARVEVAPHQIFVAVSDSLSELRSQYCTLRIQLEHEEHFRPGKPQPTHRLSSLAPA